MPGANLEVLLQTWRWLSTTRALVGVVIVEAILASNARRGSRRIWLWRRCDCESSALREVVALGANRRAGKARELAQR